MNTLIVGDVHLGRGNSIGKPAQPGKLNSRIQDQQSLLQWILDTCKSEDVRDLILTGDVYQEPRPHPSIISMFMRWLKQCEKANVIVHVVKGNHDILRSGDFSNSALDLVDAVELKLTTVYSDFSLVHLPNLELVLMPYTDKRMLEVKTTEDGLKILQDKIVALTNQLDTTKMCVAVGHLTLEGSLAVGDEISDTLNELYIPLEFFKSFNAVWMGHIHHPQVLGSNPHIAHVGSLDRSDFSRTEMEHDKIAILIKQKDKTFSTIAIPTRTLASIKIEVPSGKDSTEFVNNSLCLYDKKKSLKEAIVRLEVTLGSSEIENIQRDKVEAYLYNNLEVHYICNISESRVISQIQINPEDSFDNTMEVGFTINKWADTRTDVFESDEEREKFKSIAHQCRQDYEQKHPNQKDSNETS